jgi:hypothetical protein
VFCSSLAAVTQTFGVRQTFSFLYDGAEAAFAEGCPGMWVSRVAAASATQASLNLSDGTATTMTVKAIGPGAYGNAQSIQILTSVDDSSIPVGSFKIRVIEAGVIIEDSPVFADKASAEAWAPTSGKGNAQTFTLTDAAGTGVPVRLAATAMTGGNDQRGSLADSDWQTAISRFTIDLGPGQIAAPGQTASTRQLMLVAHALANNRHALLDLPDTPTIATLTAAMATINAAPSSGARFCSAYWPWAQTPPLTGQFGVRTVPWSMVQMGLFARAEDEGGDAGIAAAGEQHGVCRFAQGLSQDVGSVSTVNLTSLDDAGVNVARMIYGIDGPVEYGNRTPRSRTSDPIWAEASGSRLVMEIAARGDEILRNYVHHRSSAVDRAQCQLELGAMLEGFRVPNNALYGATPQEAYSVDCTSSQANSAAQLQAGLFRALISLRTSPTPSTVRLELTRVSITNQIAA